MQREKTSDRLKKIMSIRNLKQVELINKCKPICEKYNKLYNLNIQITKSDLSQWLKGLYEPSQSKLTVLAEALQTTETWLMGYDNDQAINRFVKENTISDEELERRLKQFEENEGIQVLIDNVADMSEKALNQVLNYAKFLKEQDDKEEQEKIDN